MNIKDYFIDFEVSNRFSNGTSSISKTVIEVEVEIKIKNIHSNDFDFLWRILIDVILSQSTLGKEFPLFVKSIGQPLENTIALRFSFDYYMNIPNMKKEIRNFINSNLDNMKQEINIENF